MFTLAQVNENKYVYRCMVKIHNKVWKIRIVLNPVALICIIFHLVPRHNNIKIDAPKFFNNLFKIH